MAKLSPRLDGAALHLPDHELRGLKGVWIGSASWEGAWHVSHTQLASVARDSVESSGGTVADIFFSYAREDSHTAEALANELSSRGWTVWWIGPFSLEQPNREEIARQGALHPALSCCGPRIPSSPHLSWTKRTKEGTAEFLFRQYSGGVSPPFGFRQDQDADPSATGLESMTPRNCRSCAGGF